MTTTAERLAAPFRRLARPGYRGPLLLLALLVGLTATPGGVHGGLAALGYVGSVLTAFAVALFVPVTLPLLVAVAVGIRHRRRLRLQRSGTIVLVGCALAVLAVLLGESVPGEEQALVCLGALALLALPLVWLGWQQAPAARAATHPRAGRHGPWRRAAVPVLIGAAALTVCQDVPVEGRFTLSRSGLTADALATGTPARVAGFRLQDAEPSDGGATFTVAPVGVPAPHGFACLPHGAPTGQAAVHHSSLGDGWCTWSGDDTF
ncbi:hypothetical protein [Streptomyces sp. TLI_171]|uniref:hypothetical protein n=1 Tax=Streptomyces sp. TLI_171 TaxID=1938859 RepID=UPI00117FA26C|nr:hypothetical protein [Streptomyces sp. TLI_171]